MKRMIKTVLFLLAAVAVLTGCGKTTQAHGREENRKLQIVTTIFPVYDWTRELLGDLDGEITLLLDKSTDLHSFQPTAEDMIRIADCDLFVYIGGESDGWVEEALKNTNGKNRKVLNLMEILGASVKEEAWIEGMQEEGHDHEEDAEYDEHIWLSLQNAEVLVRAISDGLQQIDPANKEAYAAHTEAYLKELAALDAQYRETIHEAAADTLLFGDRFPFRYMTDDYGLKYYAAFAGCSAETEASFETISFLAQKLDELQLDCVMTIEGTKHKIAQTIVQNTVNRNQKILTLNSMQSVTGQDVQDGAKYLTIMEQNLAVLKEALG